MEVMTFILSWSRYKKIEISARKGIAMMAPFVAVEKTVNTDSTDVATIIIIIVLFGQNFGIDVSSININETARSPKYIVLLNPSTLTFSVKKYSIKDMENAPKDPAMAPKTIFLYTSWVCEPRRNKKIGIISKYLIPMSNTFMW